MVSGISKRLGQRWLASSQQRFAFDRWGSCRLVPLFAVVGPLRRKGVARPEQWPNGGGEIHAASRSGGWLK